ncbi:hypothetical protein M0Q28_01950 [Patescibacteria group bacterium]|jgi:hypothetical protein|nr:hypothetical protein [Patescibacteria group bacterium]
MALASANGLWHVVRREAELRDAHHVRLVPLSETVELLFDAGGPYRGEEISSASLPALAMRLRRLGARSGWHAETFPAGLGVAIHLLRVRSESRPTHPADWTGFLRSVRNGAEGLTVLIQPDAYAVRHALAKLPGVTDADGWKTQDGPGLFDADDEAGRELALQAALRGLPAVAVSGRDMGAWWEILNGAVPVRVFRGYRTNHGFAWELR